MFIGVFVFLYGFGGVDFWRKRGECVVVLIKRKMVRNEWIWDKSLWKLVNDLMSLIN